MNKIIYYECSECGFVYEGKTSKEYDVTEHDCDKDIQR